MQPGGSRRASLAAILEDNVKIRLLVIVCSSLVMACGGSKNKYTTPPPDPDLPEEAVADLPAPPPEEKPEPPPPLEWSAQAELAPVKGVKMKPVTLSFHQIEGKGVHITSSDLIAGLAPGVYHVAVHESADCGKNASKVGALWDPSAGIALQITVDKKAPTELDTEVGYTLDGAESIVGHTIALHADKKGKLGKVAACGAIAATDDNAEVEEE
jgi:hypothetical protein